MCAGDDVVSDVPARLVGGVDPRHHSFLNRQEGAAEENFFGLGQPESLGEL